MKSYTLKFLCFVIVFVVSIYSANSQYNTWVINQEKSKISFKLKHLEVLTVNGFFYEFSGKILFIKNTPSYIDCIIIAKSIDTGDSLRDKTLQSNAYLNIERYPYIKFSSDDIISNGKNLIATGLLRIKNVEKKIRLKFVLKGLPTDKTFSLKTNTVLKRKDFKLDFGAMDGLIGENIDVKIELVCVKQ